MKLSKQLMAHAKPRSPIEWIHPVRVISTIVITALMAVVVWILPLRPTESAFEQRELAQFPTFSWGALGDGTYFDDISLWFSDTFPGRETLVELSSFIHSTFGLQDEVIHGSVQQGDEIPDAPTRPSATLPTTKAPTQSSKTTGSTTSKTTSTTKTTKTSKTTSKTTSTTSKKPTGSTTSTTMDPDVLQQEQSLGAILVKKDTAYEYYNFVRKAADQYVNILNRAAKKLKGTRVFSLIAPTSIDVMLEPNERPKNSSDQGKALQYLYGSLSESVHPVEVRDTLLAHRDEYLYFHTDHHWTARGAYYAFAAFAQMIGKQAPALDTFEEKAFDGFLGSFYATTQDAGLKLGGDTVYAYVPEGDISMVYGKTVSGAKKHPLIMDVTDWSPRYKYNAFIGGDNAYTCITNKDITDGSSIVVIKDSYGNALAPFLSTIYHKVYVLDFRYFTGNLSSFVKKYDVQDVLFLNNISATRNSTLIDKLEDFIG